MNYLLLLGVTIYKVKSVQKYNFTKQSTLKPTYDDTAGVGIFHARPNFHFVQTYLPNLMAFCIHIFGTVVPS